MSEQAAPSRPKRKGSFLRDRLSVAWIVAVIAVAIGRPWIPNGTWLLVHLVVLGALTHNMFVWSEHFVRALVHAPLKDHDRTRQSRRLTALLASSLLVFVGVPSGVWPLTVVGATGVGLTVLWHGAVLYRLSARALPFRFKTVVRYYLWAALCLAVGVGFGATLAHGLDDEWHGRVLIAHTMMNLLGWVGLTLMGTLVTFWPTMLRARMDDRAEPFARQALPVLLIGLALMPTGALMGSRPLAAVGLCVYVLGVLGWGRALWAPLRRKGIREFAPASVGFSMVWAAASLVGTGILLISASSWPDVTNGFVPTLVLMFVVGFACQLLVGALSYLLPSVLGGGPSVVRAGGRWFDRFASARLTLTNAGLLVWLLPLSDALHLVGEIVTLVSLASFIPLMGAGIRASVKTLKAISMGNKDAGPGLREGSLWSASEAALSLGVLALTVSLVTAFSPVSAAPAVASPTGRTVRLSVTAANMRFTPDAVTISPGDRLVIDLHDTDAANAHDLVIGGRSTGRLSPGQSATLDAGVITGPVEGWCSVPGHKQMGMTFHVRTTGASATASASTSVAGGMGMPGMGPAQGTTTGAAGTPGMGDASPAAAASVVPPAPVDAVLAPVPSGTVHRVTLHAQEATLQVSPGVWQKRWTFNGGPTGPVLHGRIGDTFEVTLVNDTSMGHSIDFHAGERASDEVMRTIPPGGSLVYRFTANRAGIWMYHCSTSPMSVHIAAGMAGAVIIDPPDLAPVDKEYVLVQSEAFVGAGSGAPATATEVDADAVATNRPTALMFNGVARQYDTAPLPASVGKRVRIWVLDAGPTRASSFHVVGAQFDTVYAEGSYLLRNGAGAAGGASGGSQTLALQPGQGGFVETTLAEPGHYPFVTHVMTDAEQGAHGVLVAS